MIECAGCGEQASKADADAREWTVLERYGNAARCFCEQCDPRAKELARRLIATGAAVIVSLRRIAMYQEQPG